MHILELLSYMSLNAVMYISEGPNSMPFQLMELAQIAYELRDACLGIIDLTHPDSKSSTSAYQNTELALLDSLAYLFKVRSFMDLLSYFL